MMDTLFNIENVSYSYNDDTSPTLALDGVSLTVAAGEIVALVGPNGCGKSTLLRLMCGLAYPSSGSIVFDEEEISERTLGEQSFAKRFHQRVGFVFQNPDTQLLCPTVREEIAFAPRQMGIEGEELEGRVADTLALFNLEEMAWRAPYHLSDGEKHRLAIACIVSMAPEVLMLDEPTTGLDEDTTSTIVSFLRAYAEAGHTVILATHDMQLVEALSARTLRMDASHKLELL